MPSTVTLDIEGFGPVLFCHASPRDDQEVVLVDSRDARWAEVFADLPAEVTTVVLGHTHMPFSRLAQGRLVVNPGSVGLPYGRTGAHWALLAEGRVGLARTPIDLDHLVDATSRATSMPGARRWLESYVLNASSEAEATAEFGPRDGR
jgi:diadenosine tetraphosphatase ApaH/serine/threonine PP2A family protein phosphatase